MRVLFMQALSEGGQADKITAQEIQKKKRKLAKESSWPHGGAMVTEMELEASALHARLSRLGDITQRYFKD